jgi:hypothetical protein
MIEKKVIGLLPSKEWLIRSGYRGLLKSMDKCPDKFKHINQNKLFKKEN